ncbi:transposase [Frankia sp. Mgl5]|uniref:transposase n=1 Tax=Frankia sp. Mgl5 TaxID=2933793 RepID=UPI002010BEB0|nr:transposase [Frankia sp. Mgl5]MCK9930718.1 transposase [Frankia sp. Mgl5]
MLVGLASAQLAGQASLSGLDRLCLDGAGGSLVAVPFAPSRTAARLSARFGPAAVGGIEATVGVLASRWLDRLPAQRRAELVTGPTLDLDSSDVEVFGFLKRGVARTYEEKKAGRPLLASWARTGLVLAADLLAGDDDVRPRAAGLLTRALANLPVAVRARPLLRADSGFFTGDLARTAVAAGVDFAIVAPRNSALWRGLRRGRGDGMDGRQGHDRRPGRHQRLRPGRLAAGHLHGHPPGEGPRRRDLR